MKGLVIGLLAILVALPALASETAAPPKNLILAGPCVTCHGPEGSGSGGIPAIKGRPAPVLLEQLKGFKQGTVASTVMGRLAKGYSDDQLALLARHFAAE